MRILGVSEKWDKLKQPRWTTFRFTRKDKDWGVGEVVQVVYKPRSKDREVLGIAEIVAKEPRQFAIGFPGPGKLPYISTAEALTDGFENLTHLLKWFHRRYGSRIDKEPMNKLTLRWRLSNISLELVLPSPKDWRSTL